MESRWSQFLPLRRIPPSAPICWLCLDASSLVPLWDLGSEMTQDCSAAGIQPLSFEIRWWPCSSTSAHTSVCHSTAPVCITHPPLDLCGSLDISECLLFSAAASVFPCCRLVVLPVLCGPGSSFLLKTHSFIQILGKIFF